MSFLRRLVLALASVTLLAGCQVDLYTGLSEEDGNRMYAILLDHNLMAAKVAEGDQLVTISVESADASQAIALLQEYGYPRDNFQNLGEVFQKQGLISSPLEERVRYIYGLSQSISETLTQIDGVLRARVHVVVPEQHPLSDQPEPSSASVFLKTRADFNLNDAIPKIKLIVQHSVEGLAYDHISVALFEADPVIQADMDSPPIEQIMGIRVARDSLQTMFTWGAVAAVVALLLLAGNFYQFWRMRRLQRGAAGTPDE
jgi:type III secretion protein J